MRPRPGRVAPPFTRPTTMPRTTKRSTPVAVEPLPGADTIDAVFAAATGTDKVAEDADGLGATFAPAPDTPVADLPQSDAQRAILDAAIAADATRTERAQAADFGAVEHLPLVAIVPSPWNPRKTFDDAEMRELAASIAASGLLQPITVRRVPHQGMAIDVPKYEIVAGERRYRAFQLNGATTIPALVRDDLDEAQIRELQLIENLQRADVPPLEEAEGVAALVAAAPHLTATDIAARTGKSPHYVRLLLALADLIDDAKAKVRDGTLDVQIAAELARLPKDLQPAGLAELGRYRHYGLREFRQWIQEHVMRQLARAPFDPTDATLNEQRGACVTCPLRTGATDSLFPELASDDRCLDGGCFSGKIATHVARLVTLKSKKGRDAIRVSTKYQPKMPGVVGSEAYRKLGASEKGCEHWRHGVVADAYRLDDVGATFRVCVQASACPVHWPKRGARGGTGDDTRAKQRAAQQLREQRMFALGQAVTHYPLPLHGHSARYPYLPDPELWRVIARHLVGDALSDETGKHLCRLLGIDEKDAGSFTDDERAKWGSVRPYGARCALVRHVDTLDPLACVRVVLAALGIGDATPGTYDMKPTTPVLDALFGPAGLSWDAVTAQHTAALEAAAAAKKAAKKKAPKATLATPADENGADAPDDPSIGVDDSGAGDDADEPYDEDPRATSGRIWE